MLGDFNENYLIHPVNNPELRKDYVHLLANATGTQGYSLINDSDEYDAHANDLLLEYKKTQTFVGGVRVIFGKKVQGKKLLPIEASSLTHFTDILQQHETDYEHVAEITRLVISAHFRPKMAMLGIIRAVLQSCVEENVNCVYTSIDPKIQRLLIRIGIQLATIKEAADNHEPCLFGRVDQIVQSVYHSHPLVWEVLTDQGKLCCPYKELIYVHDSEVRGR